MEKKINKLEHSRVEVIVTVDEKTWKDAQAKAFEKAAKNVKVDGFRPGKAPANLVKSKVDQVRVMDEAINALLPTLYRDIIENDNVKPYAQPKVDVTKLSDTELEVKFVIVTAPEVKLGEYKGLKVGHSDVKVTAKDVDAAIEGLLKQSATLVVKEAEAKEGDTVVIDFVGTIDGVPFEGGAANNHELELGSHTFIPGFEEQLVSHKAGEHVDVNVTFPENYVENLKGKAAVFACDIHEVKEKKLPELNDEFVSELKIEGVTTVEQLKEHKKAELKVQKEANEKREYLQKVYAELAKNSTVDLAEEIIEQQTNARKEDIVSRMKQSGLELTQYLQMVGQTEEQFMAKLAEDAIKDTNNYMILEEIAKVEGIEVTNEELEFEFAKIADQYNMKIEDVKKALGASVEEFRNNLKMQRVEEFLLANNE
jgi:trigger factor